MYCNKKRKRLKDKINLNDRLGKDIQYFLKNSERINKKEPNVLNKVYK